MSDATSGRTDNVATDHYRKILAKEWNRGNPLSANIELTFRCNLKCEFCYNVDDPVSREMSTPFLRVQSPGRAGDPPPDRTRSRPSSRSARIACTQPRRRPPLPLPIAEA